MSLDGKIVSKINEKEDKKPYDQNDIEQKCLNDMNEYLKKLDIHDQWALYDEIRVIGQPNRLIYYPVVACLFIGLFYLSSLGRFHRYQDAFVYLCSFVLAIAVKFILPKASYIIQFASKKKYEINKSNEPLKFIIVKEMYEHIKKVDTLIRTAKIDNFKKKK
ncbi:transmembrane protein, putative (macronuclear) [Tetrahymena thermophila SB210]|uniref:Transmembrane protein, putative n=1 Tax=Tetrahymena thermophila (strain SB210) TaxID=312017 RepID=Q23FW8_TETTS|nr:transmembrane protein, putative [Tetrahymena thermophila SB210]EAR95492.1 transmembrane protein, putative [Tetrahymena thermophila SB210]|eukprot:XP_001015737.1 transmembrane protein, putative [Tetrahymena thermophila SB210]